CRRVTTSPASSRIRRCFMTPNRDIESADSSSVSERPSRSNSRSSRNRLVGSASALNTRSSSFMTGASYVTKRSHVNLSRVAEGHSVGGTLRFASHGDETGTNPCEPVGARAHVPRRLRGPSLGRGGGQGERQDLRVLRGGRGDARHRHRGQARRVARTG